jgi:hypothetical protein
MIVGIRLQTISAVILGAFTLQPKVVLSRSSGAVWRVAGGGVVVKFIADAAVGTVGGARDKCLATLLEEQTQQGRLGGRRRQTG